MTSYDRGAAVFSQSHFSSKGLTLLCVPPGNVNGEWVSGLGLYFIIVFKTEIQPHSPKCTKSNHNNGETARDEEDTINLGRGSVGWGGRRIPTQMGDSIKCSNKYQTGRRMGARSKNNRMV